MLIILFSVKLDLFPVSGYGDTWADRLHHMVLPCLTVALALSAVLTRNLRASMLAELASDHATAARARGLPEGMVFWRHVLPNSLVPTINLLAVNIGWLIGGTVVVEQCFRCPAWASCWCGASSPATTWWCRASPWSLPAPRC